MPLFTYVCFIVGVNMAKKIAPGRDIQKKTEIEGSLLDIDPEKKKELHKLVEKKKRPFVRIIRNWIESDNVDVKDKEV